MEIIDGPGSTIGYRSVWHALQRKGIRVPRSLVEELVRELDPSGVEAPQFPHNSALFITFPPSSMPR